MNDIFEFLPFIIGVVVVVYGIVGGAIKKKQQQNKKEAAKRLQAEDDSASTLPNDDKDDFTQMREKLAAERAAADARRAAHDKKDTDPFDDRKKVTAVDDTVSKVKKPIDVQVKPSVKETHHTHPSEVAGKGQKVRKEYVATSGSLNFTPTEGCEEHANARYVLDEYNILSNDDDSMDEFQHLIVWGEILNNPKFKARH